MKKTTFLFLFSLFIFNAAYSQNWLWGRDAYCPKGAEGFGIAADEYGNAYSTGDFYTKLIFAKDTLKGANYPDFTACAIKMSPDGKPLLAVRGDSYLKYDNTGTSVCGDKWGNTYMSIEFEDTLVAGTDTLIKASAYNSVNGFALEKFNSAGKLLWAKQAYSPSWNSGMYAYSMYADDFGNVYMGGSIYDSVIWDHDTIYRALANNIFLCKLDSNGNMKWMRLNTGSGGGNVSMVTMDTHDNVYITGYGGGHLVFGKDSLLPIGYLFVVKYDSAGNVYWAKNLKGSATGSGIAVDKFGSVYASGDFNDSIVIGKDTFRYKINTDGFYVKFDSNGKVLFGGAAQPQDSNGWLASGIGVDSNENIYLGGESNGLDETNQHRYKVKFGSYLLTSYDSGYDGCSFIMKFDSIGKPICGSTLPGGADDQNFMIADRNCRHVYIGGDWASSAYICLNDTLQSGNDSPFMASWVSCAEHTESVQQMQEVANSVVVYPNPNNGVFAISAGKQSGETVVEVYNAIGQKVYSNTFSILHSAFNINLGGAAPGVYLYRIISEDGSLIGSGKLIIE